LKKTKSELEFFNLFPNKTKRWATEEEDIHLHFDVVIDGIKIDIKGLKKLNRNDNDVNSEIHWIELQNVRGNRGWLYGEADKIAFETLEGYLLIDRLTLYEFCKEKIVDRKVYNKKELYKLYQRENKKDVITLVLTKDLFNLPHELILKQ
jgi:hypothetical protein